MTNKMWTAACLVSLATTCLASLAGCGEDPPNAPLPSSLTGASVTIVVTSDAFQEGQPIPKRHTGDGENLSPPLAWTSLPNGAKELAIVVDDPDAPSAEPWVHWVVYAISPEVSSLPEGAFAGNAAQPRVSALEGLNGWKSVGYRGPEPPPGSGPHRYRFQILALDAPLELKGGLNKQALLDAAKGHVLAEGRLVGTYER